MWRIDVSPSVVGERNPIPNVTLISYPIGYDSHLFDRVRVRFRTVHDRPTVGRALGLLGPMSTTSLDQGSIQKGRQKTGLRSSSWTTLVTTSITLPSGRK